MRLDRATATATSPGKGEVDLRSKSGGGQWTRTSTGSALEQVRASAAWMDSHSARCRTRVQPPANPGRFTQAPAGIEFCHRWRHARTPDRPLRREREARASKGDGQGFVNRPFVLRCPRGVYRRAALPADPLALAPRDDASSRIRIISSSFRGAAVRPRPARRPSPVEFASTASAIRLTERASATTCARRMRGGGSAAPADVCLAAKTTEMLRQANWQRWARSCRERFGDYALLLDDGDQPPRHHFPRMRRDLGLGAGFVRPVNWARNAPGVSPVSLRMNLTKLVASLKPRRSPTFATGKTEWASKRLASRTIRSTRTALAFLSATSRAARARLFSEHPRCLA